MKKKTLLTLLLLSHSFSAMADEDPYKTGSAAGFASHDTTVLSVMLWGFLLAAGIAAICICIPNDSADSV